jgi:hypothetical protein
MRQLLFIFLPGIFLSSCESNNFEEMNPILFCDTTVEITYTDDILPILVTHCGTTRSGCHNEGGLQTYLGSYDETKDAADNGFLIGTITHTTGFPKMPNDGGKLDDCTILKIQTWVNRDEPQ